MKEKESHKTINGTVLTFMFLGYALQSNFYAKSFLCDFCFLNIVEQTI